MSGKWVPSFRAGVDFRVSEVYHLADAGWFVKLFGLPMQVYVPVEGQ